MAVLKRIKIEGFRSIDSLDLPLSGLTVLIGPNGAGKSTILEALELLRLAASRAGDFMSEFQTVHGGLYSTLRRGASCLRLEAELDGDGGPFVYAFAIREMNGYPAVDSESLSAAGVDVFGRRGSQLLPAPEGLEARLDPNSLLLQQLAVSGTTAARTVVEALSEIDVQLPFQTRAAWTARAAGLQGPSMRTPQPIRRTLRLERFGSNLANAYHAMLTEDGSAEFAKTMEYVRLGLGDHFEDIRPRVTHDGFVALRFRLRGIEHDVNDTELSDGQLAYLAFVALFRLPRKEMGRRERTLLAFDEPETHLHPSTLARVVGFCEREAQQHPVILCTQSDALLDCLDAPAACLQVCELDEERLATTVSKLDPKELEKWLEDYRGVGALRSEGYLGEVVQR
jgi:predicted ATPase